MVRLALCGHGKAGDAVEAVGLIGVDPRLVISVVSVEPPAVSAVDIVRLADGVGFVGEAVAVVADGFGSGHASTMTYVGQRDKYCERGTLHNFVTHCGAEKW